jgi:tetratricopeptide (TPR) repeat protein
MGQYNEALNKFNQAISINPEHHEAYNNLVLTYQKRGDDRNCVLQLFKAVELDPENAAYYFHMGNCYDSYGDTKTALENYEKAFNLDPSNDNYRLTADVFRKKVSYNQNQF